jgi:hypothetical protein
VAEDSDEEEEEEEDEGYQNPSLPAVKQTELPEIA